MSETFFNKYINNEISYGEFDEQASLVREESDTYAVLGLSTDEFELYKRLGKDALDNILSARKQKAEIIQKWKKFFREEIAENHRKNTLKLEHLKEFNLNPFLDNYKANFLLGDSSAKSKATALVYTRALGTSINTTFGTNLQKFCSISYLVMHLQPLELTFSSRISLMAEENTAKYKLVQILSIKMMSKPFRITSQGLNT